ncbi:MAG: aldehyde ferredoxin oxidoreductase family protein [Brevefilum sp.]|nr:aldehyde ferredoxin oxidoreductase family protein [Brevefilum sp.]
MSGFIGKVLWVDLDNHLFTEEMIPEKIYQDYLSGMGLAAHLLYEHIPPGADPLGPENVLGFVSGLLTGTPSLFSGRWMAVAKSPLTGTWGEANCGGYFSLAIKKCGYDGIFFTGSSPKPVYLSVEPGGPILLDAEDLWGSDTLTTEKLLRERHGSQRQPGVVCIGPAGERRSLIAGISHDFGRMAARSGLGAVMGSKNLKAVVLTGAKPIPVADSQAMKALSRKPAKLTRFQIPLSSRMMAFAGKFLRNPWFKFRWDGILFTGVLRKWGTVGLNQTSIEWGDAPIKNWAGTRKNFSLDQSKQITPQAISALEQNKYHCLACPLGCGATIRGEGDNQTHHRPEYETTLAFTGLVLNQDYQLVVEINDMLNRAGMDSISAGGTVAAAIEWYQDGLLTDADTGGLALNWGDGEAILALVKAMIAREGIGDLLADGSKRAAQRLKIEDRKAGIAAGGSELAFHDSRLDPGFGLHAGVEPAPGRHTSGAFIYYTLFRLWTRLKDLPKPPLITNKKRQFLPSAETIHQAVTISKFTNFYNALGICFFGIYLGIDRLPLFEWTDAATGWSRTPEEYLQIGHRIQTLRQLFNIKQGVAPKDIKVSWRALGIPPQNSGPNQGNQVDYPAMRRMYWDQIGWDPESGYPTHETLIELGLEGRVAGWEEKYGL